MGHKPFEILLVEDEEADAHLVKLALKHGRIVHRLHHVWDGVEALEFLRREGRQFQDSPRPDIILLDLNLPRLNGREFLVEVKQDPTLAHIPVVILTTSDVERDVIITYQLGASGYITKPVDMEQFFEAIRQLGEYWFMLVRLARD